MNHQERFTPALFAACLLCFCVPWDDMLQLPGKIQFARILAVLVGLFWFGSTLRGGFVRRPNLTHGFMAAFLLWTALSGFWTEDPDRTLRRTFSYVQLLAIAWVIFQSASNRVRYLRLLQAFVLGEFVLIASVMMAFANGQIWGEGRYTAPGVNPNDLAGTLALGVPVASYLTAAATSRWSWINALYTPAAIAAILLNASRTGLLALAIALAFPLLLASRFSWKTRLSALAVVAAAPFAVLNLTETLPWRRLTTIAEQFAARDFNGRMDVWSTSLQLFADRPLIGFGAGSFTSVTGSMQALSIAGHNSFLEILVETGVVGLVLFLGILFGLGHSRDRAGNLEARLWLVLGATWLVVNLANSWENKNISWLLAALALGYPAAVRFRNPAACVSTSNSYAAAGGRT